MPRKLIPDVRPTVHILATVRNPDLVAATTMVFKTLRVGFPTAQIIVHWNFSGCGTDMEIQKHVFSRANAAASPVWTTGANTIHHEWIRSLLNTQTEPFWICDTDVSFWGSMEDFDFSEFTMAGRLTEQFKDRFVSCITRPRLHTSLLYFNMPVLNEAVDNYFKQFPKTPFNPHPNLIYPTFHPLMQNGVFTNYFYDTCSMLYHAIGGRAFMDSENDRFDHLHFGTLSDLVAPCYPNEKMAVQHSVVLENPDIMRGLWRADWEFYKKYAN